MAKKDSAKGPPRKPTNQGRKKVHVNIDLSGVPMEPTPIQLAGLHPRQKEAAVKRMRLYQEEKKKKDASKIKSLNDYRDEKGRFTVGNPSHPKAAETACKGSEPKIPKSNKELRKQAFEEYCQHLEEGFPSYSFYFHTNGLSVSHETIEKYIKEAPADFELGRLEKAKSRKHQYWMNEGKKLMKGEYKGGNGNVWNILTRNICRDAGWDQDKKLDRMMDAIDSLLEKVEGNSKDLVNEPGRDSTEEPK